MKKTTVKQTTGKVKPLTLDKETLRHLVIGGEGLGLPPTATASCVRACTTA